MAFFRPKRSLVAPLFVVALAGLCLAQDWSPSSDDVFHTRTDVVALDVTVENSTGGAVPPLQADDFLVLEDNVPQTITLFSVGGELSRAVVLLIDHSESMLGEKLARAKEAAAAFVRALDSGDLVEILGFSELPERLYPLGSDHEAAERALVDLSARGTTRLYDALLVALRDIERASRDRSVTYQSAIVILSDGEDTQSRQTFEDVREDARRGAASIDTVSLRRDDHHHWLPPVHELMQLAVDTGGRAIAIRDLNELVSIYQDLGSSLRRKYRIGYVSSATARNGGWRRVSVRVPGKELVVRTRDGYYAPRPQPSGVLQPQGE